MLASTSRSTAIARNPQPESTGANVNPSARAASTTRPAFRRGDNDGLSPFACIQVRIVRIFNTYGDRMRRNDGGRSQFHHSGLAGKPITVYGDARRPEAFASSRLVSASIGSCDRDSTSRSKHRQSARSHGRELAETLRRSPAPVKVILKPLPNRRPQANAVRHPPREPKLHWSQDPLEQGLRRTIDYFQKSK